VVSTSTSFPLPFGSPGFDEDAAALRTIVSSQVAVKRRFRIVRRPTADTHAG